MKKILIFTGFLFFTSSVFAYWEWTPQTKKWINPEYAVKETDQKQWEWAQQLQKENKTDRAVNEYQKLIKHYPASVYAPKSLFEIGEIYSSQGNYSDAFDAYQAIIEKYPQYPDISIVLDREKTIAAKFLTKKDTGIKKIFSNSEGTVNKVSEIITTDPYSSSSADLSLQLALKYSQEGETEKSEMILNKIIQDFPGTAWEEKARYQIVEETIKSFPKSITDMEKFKELENAINQFLSDFPSSQYKESLLNQKAKIRNRAAGQLYAIAKFYEKTDKKQAASIYYQEIKRDYPDTDYAKIIPSF